MKKNSVFIDLGVESSFSELT